jgi:predicted TIM-barrel fold metal-dependent hydrolase
LNVIDVWAQHPTAQFLSHDMFEHIRRWMGIQTVPDTIPPELTLGAMDAGKVQLALLSAWWGPQGPLLSNDEVAAVVAAHPDRFRGVASVDLRRPMAAVRELRRCVRELGFVGLRMLPWWWERPPSDALYYPLYAECVELGIPFCLQVGQTGPAYPSEPGRPIPHLERVVLDFPELVVVGGHIGAPWTQEMIFLATKFPNVYLDTSAYKAKRYPPELVAFMAQHGRRKVLFGSNFPMIQPMDALRELPALNLSEEVRADFLSENARRVFNLASAFV